MASGSSDSSPSLSTGGLSFVIVGLAFGSALEIEAALEALLLCAVGAALARLAIRMIVLLWALVVGVT